MTLRNAGYFKSSLFALMLAFLIPGVCSAQSTPPDLTVSGAIATLKTNDSTTPKYTDTFNPYLTRLCGWIHCCFDEFDLAAFGGISDASRQILVTTASSPGDSLLAVDDVILGTIAATTAIPL